MGINSIETQMIQNPNNTLRVSCDRGYGGSGAADAAGRRKKMPLEVSHSRLPVSSFAQFTHSFSPYSKLDQCLEHKDYQSRKMKFTGKKLIPVLVLVLASISILRLLRIAVKTSSSSPLPALPETPLHTCSPPSPACRKTPSQTPGTSATHPNTSALTEKEFNFLLDIISSKTPCNLLVFGLEPQYVRLSSTNAGGLTIILEDDADKLNRIKTNSSTTQIYKVEYQIPAKKAYKMLKHGRQNPACAMGSASLEASTCPLALTKLPKEVQKLKWDIVVVDGPSGDQPEAPGRMAAIYTAGVMARSGNMTQVIVHDVDRMIERWFSWEFLCEENLVSSKGKLWNFRIGVQSNPTRFCPSKTNLTE